MSLVGFHRFLIVTAILFCLGFGVWELNAAAAGDGAQEAVLGSVFLLLGIGLVVYLRRLTRFLGYEDDSSTPR